VSDAYEAKLKAILTADQMKQLHQRTLRIQGPHALAEGVLRDELELSDIQRAQLDALFKDAATEMNALSRMMSDREKRAEALEKIRKFDEALRTKCEAILTEAQRDKWQAQMGDPAK
jgi:hypothetical protein